MIRRLGQLMDGFQRLNEFFWASKIVAIRAVNGYPFSSYYPSSKIVNGYPRKQILARKLTEEEQEDPRER